MSIHILDPVPPPKNPVNVFRSIRLGPQFRARKSKGKDKSLLRKQPILWHLRLCNTLTDPLLLDLFQSIQLFEINCEYSLDKASTEMYMGGKREHVSSYIRLAKTLA